MSPLISIPNVRIGERLGEGAAATVFAGTLADTGRAVAVKVVPARRQDPAGLVDRALQEGRLSWSLDHPNVVRVFGSGQTADGHVWILMERLVGETLHERLARQGALAPAEVLGIARDVARGLSSVHARGVVHRDMKPDNVFLCSGPPEHAKLLDLGIASLASNDPTRLVRTQAGLVFGTPGYMAPEQALGEPIDARADVYGIAATMYHCLTGRVPHEGGSVVDVLRRLVQATEPPPIIAGVPAGLAELVYRCLHPDASRRPPDAAAMLASLELISCPPAAGFAKTTVVVDDRTLRVDDLHVPALGDAVDHRRFRQHIVMALAAVFRPGHLPVALQARLTEVDRLNDAHAAARERLESARAGANAAAADLQDRARRLEDALQAVEGRVAAMKQRHVQLEVQLLTLADDLVDADRAYVEAYRAIESLQRGEAARASERSEPVELSGLFGQRIRAHLETLDAAMQRRTAALDHQQSLRAEMRRARGGIGDLAHQAAELRRSLLGLEAERHARITQLEDDARVADDALLHIDRSLEHAFLRLGVAFHAELLAG